MPHELLSRGWTLCLVLLVTGSLCLVADAGRPERVISLWLSPSLHGHDGGRMGSSGFGACWRLSSLFVSNGAGARLPLFVVLAAAIAAVIAGVATAIYTGVLSRCFPRLSLLGHGLFRHSSVFRRCRGVAVVFGTASFVDSRVPFNAALRCLSRVDRAIIVAEMVALASWRPC